MSNERLTLALSVACVMALTACGGKGVECGSGTIEENGQCVPVANNNENNGTTGTNNGGSVACGPGTELDGDRCIVSDPVVCGAGTERDANSGECLPTEEACGVNTAFDAASGTCLPVDSVCAEGTVWSDASAMCMPEAVCAPGDVVIAGVCARPVEELIGRADLTEVENNDPDMGGTAQTFTLADYIISGSIGDPTDLDGDGNVDQDVDVFEFDAESGQWITITLQTTGEMPLIWSVINTSNNDERLPRAAFGGGAARQFATTSAGTYRLVVLPLEYLYERTQRVGEPDAQWVAEVTVDQAPMARSVDLSTPQTGRFTDLANNRYRATNVMPGELVTVGFDVQGSDAVGVVSVFDGADFVSSHRVEGAPVIPVVVPPNGLELILDYIRVSGPNDEYTVTAQSDGRSQSLGTLTAGAVSSSTPIGLDDQGAFFLMDLPAKTILELGHTNAGGHPVIFRVTGPDGNTTEISFVQPIPGPFSYQYVPALAGGTFIVEVVIDPAAPSGPVIADFVLEASAVTTRSLGTLAPGGTQSTTIASLDVGRSRFLTIDLAAGQQAQLTQDNGQDEVVRVIQWLMGWTAPGPMDFVGDPDAPFSPSRSARLSGDGTELLIELSADIDLTGIAVTVTDFMATDLGTVTPPATIDETNPGPLTAGDANLYSVTFPSEVVLVGTVTAPSGDVDFIIKDSIGMDVVRATTLNDENVAAIVPAGTYTMEVAAYNALPAGWHVLLDVGIAPTDDEVEPNDTQATATPLTTSIRGEVQPGEVDHFSFTVTTAGLATLSLVGDATADAAILNADGDVIHTGEISGQSFSLSGPTLTTYLEPGSYVASLSIGAMGFGGGTYALFLSQDPSGADLEDSGSNDDAMTAQTAVPTAGYTLMGVVASATDTDWYAIDLAAPAEFILTSLNSTAATWEFQDAMQAPIAAVNGVYTLPMGRSYLVVSGFDPAGPDNQYHLKFDSPPDVYYGFTPNLPIPDGGQNTNNVATSVASVTETCTIASVQVGVGITHPYQGDLVIDLVSPTATTVRLWDGTGGPADNLVGTFPFTLTPAQSLDAFAGESATGDWTLKVGDKFNTDAGTLNSWSLGIVCQ